MSVRILVVEDNPENLDLMTYLLNAFGYTVLTACDGEEGLEAARRELPDLILCDLQMPKLDGFEVIRQLRLEPALENCPVVAVTAYAMLGDRTRVLDAGFDGYLTKPIVPEEFAAQVEQFLKLRHVPLVKPVTILVVDHSPVNVSLMRSTLEPFGYRVLSAFSVKEGLEIARGNALDLILSDLHMPEADGYEFLKVVRGDPALRALPFAIISSTVWRDVDPKVALSMGANRFILRPIEPARLLAEVHACLAGKPDRYV